MTLARLQVPTPGEHEDDVTVITLDGERVPGKANQMGIELQGIFDKIGQHHLALDLCNLTQINGETLGMLVRLHRKCLACGWKRTLHNVHPQLEEVFEVPKLDTVLDIR
jgi:anti-anti-sigma regulatory factor